MSTRTHRKFYAGLSTIAFFLLFLVGLLLECRSLLPLFISFSLWRTDGWLFILSHIMANTIMAWAMLQMLPNKYRANGFKAFLYFFLLGLFIPIVGNLGLITVLILGIKREKSTDNGDIICRFTEQVPMPIKPSTVPKKPKFGIHGMQSRLQKSANTEEHLCIVLATRFMSNNHAIPLLKIALRNSEDEVRLLAFSMLEKKNTEIFTRIETLRQRLGFAEKKEKIHVAIARNYFNLVVLGLIQEEMKSQVLAKAHQHLQKSLDRDPGNRNASFIMGQVLLESGTIEQALQAFESALDLGYPPSAVNPFLAEIAYQQRQFQKIPAYIQQIPVGQRVYPPLADVAAYWL